jgi:hypothetical protein
MLRHPPQGKVLPVPIREYWGEVKRMKTDANADVQEIVTIPFSDGFSIIITSRANGARMPSRLAD